MASNNLEGGKTVFESMYQDKMTERARMMLEHLESIYYMKKNTDD